MPLLIEDRTLLDRFRAGERSALARVYSFYFDDVMRLAQLGFVTKEGVQVGRIARDADRMDFVHDVFVRAFSARARESYDGLRPYRPFLLRIARNLRVDRARDEKREPSAAPLSVAPLPNLDELIESGCALPTAPVDADLAWQQLSHEAARVVASLGPESAELTRLRFGEELSQQDVAERLGMTRRRVRTLEGRLLRAVKKKLSLLGLELKKK